MSNNQVWSASKHDEIIKRLMNDIGQPNSQSVYGAFKQFANELHALREPAPTRPEPTAYLISHAKHGRALDFQQITDGDRNAGFSSEALYTNAPQSTAINSDAVRWQIKRAISLYADSYRSMSAMEDGAP